jgi:uncharacterized protein YfdQ (DUF2303 family)
MKSWILPSIAIGAVVFLMTRPGRELQEQVSDHFGDWADNLVRTNHRVQDTLSQVQALLDRFNRSLQQAS